MAGRYPTWIIHNIYPDEQDPEYCMDSHTHGMNEFGHTELAMVIAVGAECINNILNAMGFEIWDGKQFKEGVYTDVLAGEYPVRLVKAKYDDNHDVMVVFLPDANKKLPGDEGCAYPYSEQPKFLEHIIERYK